VVILCDYALALYISPFYMIIYPFAFILQFSFWSYLAYIQGDWFRKRSLIRYTAKTA